MKISKASYYVLLCWTKLLSDEIKFSQIIDQFHQISYHTNYTNYTYINIYYIVCYYPPSKKKSIEKQKKSQTEKKNQVICPLNLPPKYIDINIYQSLNLLCSPTLNNIYFPFFYLFNCFALVSSTWQPFKKVL